MSRLCNPPLLCDCLDAWGSKVEPLGPPFVQPRRLFGGTWKRGSQLGSDHDLGLRESGLRNCAILAETLSDAGVHRSDLGERGEECPDVWSPGGWTGMFSGLKASAFSKGAECVTSGVWVRTHVGMEGYAGHLAPALREGREEEEEEEEGRGSERKGSLLIMDTRAALQGARGTVAGVPPPEGKWAAP